MNCEYCNKIVTGEYGSGRFCDKKCASGFSTKKDRKSINLKVSAKMKRKPPAHSFGFKEGYDKRRKKLIKKIG